MIKKEDFWQYLKDRNFTLFSGVPCSIFKAVLSSVLKNRSIKYIPATREDIALGVASGSYIAARRSGLLIQNSGLGHIINGLTSFNLLYKIPVIIFISWRGYKGKDAPEHKIMGRKTISLLKELGVPCRVLSKDFKRDIDWAISEMDKKSIPAALIVKAGAIK